MKKPEHRSSQKSTEEIEIHPVDNEECVEVLQVSDVDRYLDF